MSEKKTKKMALLLNLPIEKIIVRGGTNHRRDLCLTDGSIIFLYKDGIMEKSNLKWK